MATEDEAAHNEQAASVFQACSGGMRAAAGTEEIYFMGIIDILQLYNAGKQLETFFKGFTNDRCSALTPLMCVCGD